MAKFEKKEMAYYLRNKGYLLSEIAQRLAISKSTASAWCKKLPLSPEQLALLQEKRERGRNKGRLLGAQRNKELRAERLSDALSWAVSYLEPLSQRDLMLIGIGLYWGEGAKDRKFNLTNSDPKVILLMKEWLWQIFTIPPNELLVRISINESHRDRYAEVQRFWENVLGLPVTQFYCPTFVKTPHKKVYENRKSYYGVVSLRVRKSTDLQYKILGLIQAIGHADIAQVVRASHS